LLVRKRVRAAALLRAPTAQEADAMNPVLEYIVADRRTGEWVIRCASRSQARRIAREADGVVLEVRRAK
jgi:hypothetical protein